MIIEKEVFTLDGKEIVFRCAEESDAQVMMDTMKILSGETRFLRKAPDEIAMTLEDELAFIHRFHSSPRALFVLVTVDGEYAGSCSFTQKGGTRRNAHRAVIGIALLQRFTKMGIGTRLMEKVIRIAKAVGYEQCELDVVGINHGAYHLYEKLGFVECGRIPMANRYDDGTYSDEVTMVLDLRKKR